MAEHVLNHEAPNAGASVDRRQDEQSLEQDGEVIPECLHRLAADRLGEDLRHSHR